MYGTFIIEGVAILPRLARTLMSRDKRVRVIFLVDTNEARIRKTIFTRGLWDDANKYPGMVKAKEVAWVLAFNTFITLEAKKYKLPTVSIGDRKSYLREVQRLIGRSV